MENTAARCGGRGRPAGRLARVQKGILGKRQRRLAWFGFVLLAGYAPVVAWLKPDDTWLMPVAVAAVIGYVLIIDDVLRHRGARADEMAMKEMAPKEMAMKEMALTRDRRVGDDPGSSFDATASDAPVSRIAEPAGSGGRESELTGSDQRPER